jgi:hypothetical protein
MQDFTDKTVSGNAFGFRFETEDQPMTQHVEGYGLDVIR